MHNGVEILIYPYKINYSIRKMKLLLLYVFTGTIVDQSMLGCFDEDVPLYICMGSILISRFQIFP
jgi:hypothetical protein